MRCAAAFLLLLPLVAMQFTDEVQWTASDFAVFGTMLLVACGAYELALWASGNPVYRAAAAVAVGTAFFLVWSNLAVGLIGSERNPDNVLYVGVLAVGIVGAVVARLRAPGLAWTLVAMAVAQVLVPAIARALGSVEVLLLTGTFVALWFTSAWLFRKAAREETPVRGQS